MKRRDLLLAGKLLRKHKFVEPGEMDPGALMLAARFVQGEREGKITISFDEWLDQDADEDELDDSDDKGNPTAEG